MDDPIFNEEATLKSDELSDRFPRSHEKKTKQHARSIALGTYVEPSTQDSKASKGVRKLKKDDTAVKEASKKDGTLKGTPKKDSMTGNVKKDKKGAGNNDPAKVDAAKRDTGKKLEMDIGTSATDTSDADFEDFLALQDKAHYAQQEDDNKLEGQEEDVIGHDISNIDMNAFVLSTLQQQARTAIL